MATIVMLIDDPVLRETLENKLLHADHEIAADGNPNDIMSLIKMYEDMDVCVIDKFFANPAYGQQRLATGEELANVIRKHLPDVSIVLLSDKDPVSIVAKINEAIAQRPITAGRQASGPANPQPGGTGS